MCGVSFQWRVEERAEIVRYKLLYHEWGKELEDMKICVESDDLKIIGHAVADRGDKEFIVWDTQEGTLKLI